MSWEQNSLEAEIAQTVRAIRIIRGEKLVQTPPRPQLVVIVGGKK